MIKILAFAGSTRKGSFNKSLVKAAMQGAASQGAATKDVELTFVDLADYPMPLLDQDLESELGIPNNALKLKALMSESDGFLIASPEYNGGYSGVLKNTLDWASRQAEGETSMQCFKNKLVVCMSASPGALGGIRGLPHIRTLLSGLGCIVLPKQLAIAKAHEVFADNGEVKQPEKLESMHALGAELVEFIRKIKR
jgi:NAD(P)H-dependent FMN reductase